MHPKSIVTALSIVLAALVIVYAALVMSESRPADMSENYPAYTATPSPSISSEVSATPAAQMVSGRCTPTVVIETFEASPDETQRMANLYQACLTQTDEQSCTRIDQFNANNGTWRPDGKTDCRWREN